MTFFPIAGLAGELTGRSTAGVSRNAIPMVLLHGIQGSARAWDEVLKHLPNRIPTLAPNLRGRGGSVAPTDPMAYSVDSFADDLAAVLDALERPSFLVGWSMGVLVSLAYLRRYGQNRLSALVLMSGTSQGSKCQWFSGENAEEIAQEAELRATRLALKESAAPMAAAGAWLSVRCTDFRSVLPSIDVPTLVIHGSADDQCPLSHGQLLADTIPGAEIALLDGGVHNMLAQDPAWVASRLVHLYDSVTQLSQ
ncbi:alpha/beta fold hydrolase [Marinobacter salarius]